MRGRWSENTPVQLNNPVEDIDDEVGAGALPKGPPSRSIEVGLTPVAHTPWTIPLEVDASSLHKDS